jgi:hypothetical protein
LTTTVNITAPDLLCALPDNRVVRTGSLDTIEIRNIEKSGFDGGDKTKGFCRRRTPPIQWFIGSPLPGFAVNDHILPQIHCKK